MIRYRRSRYGKRCRLGIRGSYMDDSAGTARESKVYGLRGEYGRKTET